MQYVLFVLACLSNEPSQCVGEKIDLPEITNATACHLAGQYTLNGWLAAHRDMELREAKCMARPLFGAPERATASTATGG